MNNPGLFQAKWNLRRWALCNLLAIGLLCFWLRPAGQMLCVFFDEWLFHLLNAPLAKNSTWLHGWAVASLRPFDVDAAKRRDSDKRLFPGAGENLGVERPFEPEFPWGSCFGVADLGAGARGHIHRSALC